MKEPLLSYSRDGRPRSNRAVLLLLAIAIAMSAFALSFGSIKKSIYRASVRRTINRDATVAGKMKAINEWAAFVTKRGSPAEVFDVLPTTVLKSYDQLQYVVVLTGDEKLYVWATNKEAGATTVDVTTYADRLGIVLDWPKIRDETPVEPSHK